MTKYRLWVDREGSPKIVELKEELSESEIRAVAEQWQEALTHKRLLILSPDWEVAVL